MGSIVLYQCLGALVYSHVEVFDCSPRLSKSDQPYNARESRLAPIFCLRTSPTLPTKQRESLSPIFLDLSVPCRIECCPRPYPHHTHFQALLQLGTVDLVRLGFSNIVAQKTFTDAVVEAFANPPTPPKRAPRPPLLAANPWYLDPRLMFLGVAGLVVVLFAPFFLLLNVCTVLCTELNLLAFNDFNSLLFLGRFIIAAFCVFLWFMVGLYMLLTCGSFRNILDLCYPSLELKKKGLSTQLVSWAAGVLTLVFAEILFFLLLISCQETGECWELGMQFTLSPWMYV